MHTLKFLAEVSANGVVERDFIVDGVPGVIWSPTSGAEQAAVVLLGHGGGLHKKTPAQVARAHQYVTGCGYHVVAIDAPGHGDRPRYQCSVGGYRRPGVQTGHRGAHTP